MGEPATGPATKVFFHLPHDAEGLPLLDPDDVPRDADGLPLAETMTEEQAELALLLRDVLRHHARREGLRWETVVDRAIEFRSASEEGTVRILPDVAVLVDSAWTWPDPGPLRTWVAGGAPAVVFELASGSSLEQDLGEKVAAYDELGVEEYFVLDLHRRRVPGLLAGYRRGRAGSLQPIPAPAVPASGWFRLPSRVLGDLELAVVPDARYRAGCCLRPCWPGGGLLPTPAEAELEARDAELEARDAELRALRRRLAELEDESS